jgi:hypothetical protein
MKTLIYFFVIIIFSFFVYSINSLATFEVENTMPIIDKVYLTDDNLKVIFYDPNGFEDTQVYGYKEDYVLLELEKVNGYYATFSGNGFDNVNLKLVQNGQIKYYDNNQITGAFIGSNQENFLTKLFKWISEVFN